MHANVQTQHNSLAGTIENLIMLLKISLFWLQKWKKRNKIIPIKIFIWLELSWAKKNPVWISSLEVVHPLVKTRGKILRLISTFEKHLKIRKDSTYNEKKETFVKVKKDFTEVGTSTSKASYKWAHNPLAWCCHIPWTTEWFRFHQLPLQLSCLPCALMWKLVRKNPHYPNHDRGWVAVPGGPCRPSYYWVLVARNNTEKEATGWRRGTSSSWVSTRHIRSYDRSFVRWPTRGHCPYLSHTNNKYRNPSRRTQSIVHIDPNRPFWIWTTNSQATDEAPTRDTVGGLSATEVKVATNSVASAVEKCGTLLDEAMGVWNSVQNDPVVQQLRSELRIKEQQFTKIRMAVPTFVTTQRLARLHESKAIQTEVKDLRHRENILETQM